jgi:hypothetical protein
MSFLNPWAWLGLCALAVPILIHLLTRRTARTLPFPTLRFLPASRLTPQHRLRMSDVPLLLIRCAILVAAVFALAQPVLHNRDRTADAALARVVLVDTSASMLRDVRAIDAARAEAQRLSAETATALIIESAAPAAQLQGAAAWLATQQGRGEVAIVSDFQDGEITAADLEVLPAHIGIELVRVVGDTVHAPITAATRHGTYDVVASIGFRDGRSIVEWSPRAAEPARMPLIVAGPEGQSRLDAAQRAAWLLGAPAVDSLLPLAVLFPGYPGLDSLLAGAQPLEQSWMAETVRRLRADRLLANAAARDSSSALIDHARFLTIARNERGETLVSAAALEGQQGLLLFCTADPGSLTAAALIAAAMRAASPVAPLSEFEPETLPADVLAQWERAPSTAPSAGGPADDPVGGWFWLAALLLLGAETLLRRNRNHAQAQPAASEMTYERVA